MRFLPWLLVCSGLTANCPAADPTTQPATKPDASIYPALQRMLVKLQDRVKEVEAQNTTLIHENIALQSQVIALTPKPKIRPGHAPNDGKPHPELITLGMSLEDVVDLAGVGNVAATRRTPTASTFVIYTWVQPPIDNGNGARRVITEAVIVSADDKVFHINQITSASPIDR